MLKGKAPLQFLPLTNMISNDIGQIQKVVKTMNDWRPPAIGTVCMNVDAAFAAANGDATAGIIMRDHSGSVCLVASHPISRCSDAEEAEGKAILLGLQIAKNPAFGYLGYCSK